MNRSLYAAAAMTAVVGPAITNAQAAPVPPTASATSQGQTGGVTSATIGTLNYYSGPPVTDQERAIALERLALTLNELATYRERPADLGELSLLETIRTERIARRLYVVLCGFFDPTIAQTRNGSELLAFKKRYNRFARRQSSQERQSLEYIGKESGVAFSGAWDPLLRYMILRAYRGSKDSVKASGLTLISAHWDEAEALFHRFISDEAGGAWLIPSAQEQETLIGTADRLLQPFEQADTESDRPGTAKR